MLVCPGESSLRYGGFEYSGFPTIFYLGPGSEKVSKVQEPQADGLILSDSAFAGPVRQSGIE